METKTNEELKKVLDELYKKPSEELKEDLEGLTMKFSEWNRITGENTRFTQPWRELDKNEMAIYEDRKEISYLEFQELLSKPYSRTFNKVSKSLSDPDLREMKSKWDQIKVKCDPIKEIRELSQSISTVLSSNPHNYKEELDTMVELFFKAKEEMIADTSTDTYMIEIVEEISSNIEKVMAEVNKFEELISNHSNEETANELDITMPELEEAIEEELINSYNTSAKAFKLKEYAGYDLENGKLVVKDKEKADETMKNVIYSECVLPYIEDNLDRIQDVYELRSSKKRNH